MASKSNIQLISIALMVIGIGLAYWGYDMSGGLDSQLNQAFSGSSSDGVMIRYIAGAASFAAGLFLFLKK
jgi:Protein of unknown function (DUF3185)